MYFRTARHSLCAIFALALAAGEAGAQTSKNAAGAEALYEQARGLMKQGDFEHACPKFKQSYDLDAGGGTLLNLAECYEKQGKFASAWSSFKEALVVAQRDGRPERVEYAKKHIALVEPQVAKITIEVPTEVNEPGLSVSLDGAPLGDAAWGVGMPVDPGAHQVAASAPNKQSYEQTVHVANGSTSIKIPKLIATTTTPAATTGPASVTIDRDVEKKPVVDEPTNGQGQRTVGLVIGGAGVVALGVGSYFGLHAISKWSDRKDNCPNGACTAQAKAAGDDAKSAALISDIGFGVGIIAAAVGTYLVLSAKPTTEATSARAKPMQQARSLSVVPAFGPLGGGLVLRGNY